MSILVNSIFTQEAYYLKKRKKKKEIKCKILSYKNVSLLNEC